MTPPDSPFDDENRTGYTWDDTLHATVIPTGKRPEQGGGSLGFDANNPKVKQNIVVCEDNNMRTIAVVDSAEIKKASSPDSTDSEEEPTLPDPANVEKAFLTAVQKDEPPSLGSPTPAGPLGPPPGYDARAAGQTPIPQPTVTPRIVETVSVVLKGTFGKMKCQYSNVFRDGRQLVLQTNNHELGVTYELPEVEDEAMLVEVTAGDKQLSCVWAGIQFTLPDDSVTFTVLLVAEEHNGN